MEPSPGSCQTPGGGVGGGCLSSDRVGTLSVVRKHELMPRFPWVAEIGPGSLETGMTSGGPLVIELRGLGVSLNLLLIRA